MRIFRRRDDELHRLEAELRANRPEPPREFILALVESLRGENRRLRPKVRVGFAVALAGLALAAMASAGGFGVIAQTTKAALRVVHRTTHSSPRLTVFDNPGNKQYKKHCGDTSQGEDKCHITIFDSSVREGNSGTTPMNFTISLDAQPDVQGSVQWSTSSGLGTTFTTGTCPGQSTTGEPDYQSGSGSVSFPPASQTITVSVCGDKVKEPDETLFVNLTGASPSTSYDIVRNKATGTIINDDR